MAAILIPSRWRQQPTYPVAINRGHELGRGIRYFGAFGIPGVPHDMSGYCVPAFVGSPTTEYTYAGKGIRLTSASSQYINLGNPAALQFTSGMSALVHYRLTTVPAAACLIGKDSNTGGRAYTLDSLSGPGGGLRFYINGGGGATESRVPVAGDQRWAAATYNGRDQYTAVYVDGALKGSATENDTSIPSSTSSCRIGAREYSGFEDYFNGTFYYVALWNHALSAGDVRALYENPYQMLVPIQRRIYVEVAGSDVTLALTGLSATAAVGSLGPEVSVPLVGNSASASVGNVVPGISIVLSGASMTASMGTLTPALSYALSGLDVTSAGGTLVQGTSYALTGLSATIAQGTLTAVGGAAASIWTNVNAASTTWTNVTGASTTWTNQ